MAAAPTYDSILVTNLPSLANVLQNDLKQMIVGHFANFGIILRVSCAMGKKERTAHIQFSSAVEAAVAVSKGKMMRGHSLTIKVTDKHPTTQLLKARPAAVPSTLSAPVTVSSSSPSTPRPSAPASYPNPRSLSTASIPTMTVKYPKQNQQLTLQEVLVRSSSMQKDVKERKPSLVEILEQCDQVRDTNMEGGPMASPILNTSVSTPSSGRVNGSSSTNYGGNTNAPNPSTTAAQTVSHGTGVDLNISSGTTTTSHPCLTMEVYKPAHVSNAHKGPPAGPSATSKTLTTISATSVSRPTRSLREIFKFDIPGMKVIRNNVEASDALACQYFTGGAGCHPFPLAMMFGRTPGSVIMPVKSIMTSIKPGLEIKQATLELIWNSVVNPVVKTIVLESAGKNLALEITCKELFPECADEFLNNFIMEKASEMAEEQVNREVDLMICCEDEQEKVIASVCEEILQQVVVKEIQLEVVVRPYVLPFYDNLEEGVVATVIHKSAQDEFLNTLCGEVIEDLLELLHLWIAVIGASALKNMKMERTQRIVTNEYMKLEEEAVTDFVKKVAYNEYLEELFGEIVEDLLDSNYFNLIVKVVVRDFIRQYQEADHIDRRITTYQVLVDDLPSADARQRAISWVEELPSSQSSVESHYISPSASLSSSPDSSVSQESASSQMQQTPQSQILSQLASTPDTAEHELSVSPIPITPPETLPTSLFGSIKRKAFSLCQIMKRPRLQ